MAEGWHVPPQIRIASLGLLLLPATICWWLDTSIFRYINATDLRYWFPAILLAGVCAIDRAGTLRSQVVSAILVSAIGSAILLGYGRELAPTAASLILLNALLVVLKATIVRRPESIVRMVVVLLATGVGLGLAEIGTRVLVTFRPEDRFGAEKWQERGPVYLTHFIDVGEPANWHGFEGPDRANSVRLVEGREFSNRIQLNGKGLRGPELPYEKPANAFRIMFLGDSFVEAFHVPYEDTIQVQLARLLRERRVLADRSVEVFGAGVSGWGTVNEYLFYRHEGRLYEADLVILTFVGNDPDNDILDQPNKLSDEARHSEIIVSEDEISTRARSNVRDNVSLAVQRAMESFPRPLREHSALWRMSYDYLGRPAELEAMPQVERAVLDPRRPQGWKNTEIAVRLLKHQVEAHGGALVIMSVPLALPVNVEQDPMQLDNDRGVGAIAAKLEIPWLNLLPHYLNYMRAGHPMMPDIYGVLHKHWTPSGHAMTARIVADWLVAQKTIE